MTIEETLKQIENYSKLSATEKILFDDKKKRDEINERKSIYEKIIS